MTKPAKIKMTLKVVTLQLTDSQMGKLQTEWNKISCYPLAERGAVAFAAQPAIFGGELKVYFFTPEFSRELNKFLKQERFKP